MSLQKFKAEVADWLDHSYGKTKKYAKLNARRAVAQTGPVSQSQTRPAHPPSRLKSGPDSGVRTGAAESLVKLAKPNYVDQFFAHGNCSAHERTPAMFLRSGPLLCPGRVNRIPMAYVNIVNEDKPRIYV